MKERFWYFFIVLFAWVAGCKTEMASPGIGDDLGAPGPMTCIDRDGDGYGFNCPLGQDCDDSNAAITNQCYVCAHDEPGCPCTTEGARASCGKVTARVGDQTTCGYGSTVCTGGKWGDCALDGTSRSFTSSRNGLGLAPPTACLGNVCDPYCKQYPDTPDDSLTTHTGIIGTDAGLTVDKIDGSTGVYQANGPVPDRIQAQLADAGLYPDAAPDAIIYHELPPTVTAADDVTGTASIKSADVYFMNYTTGLDGIFSNAVWYSLNTPGNVFDQVRANLPDPWLGVGRYEQYDKFGWNWSGHPTIAYHHVLTMSPDPLAARNGIDWVHNQFYNAGMVGPMSWIDALYAMSTTGGLHGSFGGYWVLPRSSWTSPMGGDSSACPFGWGGYPCFRPWALPITVLFAQSPSNNGPGGQYAYAHNSTYGISGSSTWPATTAVTGNYTEATAYAVDPVEQYHGYSGTTTGAMNNQAWWWAPSDTCPTGRGSTAPNVFFKFHASQRTSFHFDTFGSAIDTALYMYNSNGLPIVCNDHHFFTGNPTIIPASIDGYVDPGDYFVVVDGFAAVDVGNYVLHVGQMPDGAAASDPNYDETVAAFNALGAKFVSVDTSTYTCATGPTAFVQRNTGNALDRFGIDTGSVDATGKPYRIAVDSDDGVCFPGDPAIDQQIGGAITDLFNTTAGARMDVTAVAVDVDDPIDFDGPPGGSTILTPTNIDDATFVQSIVTVATPATNANCQQTLPDRFVGCTPGTNVTFHATFKTPPTVPVLDHEQIFSFVIRTLRNGKLVLSETPVVIVVPSMFPSQYVDAWFIRDYDTTDACPKGTAPRWGFFSWDALTPSDSSIDFEIAVAPSVAELPSSPDNDSLLFSNPPGPALLAGQPIGVRAGVPDTRFGGTMVDDTIAANGWPRDSRAMRLRAHLMPSTDRLQAPVLQLWNQQISCQPAE
jgi:hypothetical protein